MNANYTKIVCCEKVKIMQLKIGRREEKEKVYCCYLGNGWELKDTNKNKNLRVKSYRKKRLGIFSMVFKYIKRQPLEKKLFLNQRFYKKQRTDISET